MMSMNIHDRKSEDKWNEIFRTHLQSTIKNYTTKSNAVYSTEIRCLLFYFKTKYEFFLISFTIQHNLLEIWFISIDTRISRGSRLKEKQPNKMNKHFNVSSTFVFRLQYKSIRKCVIYLIFWILCVPYDSVSLVKNPYCTSTTTAAAAAFYFSSVCDVNERESLLLLLLFLVLQCYRNVARRKERKKHTHTNFTHTRYGLL